MKISIGIDFFQSLGPLGFWGGSADFIFMGAGIFLRISRCERIAIPAKRALPMGGHPVLGDPAVESSIAVEDAAENRRLYRVFGSYFLLQGPETL